MLANPPYGKSWKKDLEAMGGKEGMRDPRFKVMHEGEELSLVTRSSDGQMLFLANMASKMNAKSVLGSRIATESATTRLTLPKWKVGEYVSSVKVLEGFQAALQKTYPSSEVSADRHCVNQAQPTPSNTPHSHTPEGWPIHKTNPYANGL
jgi:hypothetical protein